MIARRFIKSTSLFIPKRGISLYSPVIGNVNHNTLLSKLRCNNLDRCNCANFVHSLSIKEIEQSKSVWLKFMKSHHKWCPVGPPGTSEPITQEEEEAELQRELMEKDIYYYDLDPIENEWDEEILMRAA
tara:strand:- start:285 stop:671 length:387 start_codon:yes stop_codon:yes gene_type:complete